MYPNRVVYTDTSPQLVTVERPVMPVLPDTPTEEQQKEYDTALAKYTTDKDAADAETGRVRIASRIVQNYLGRYIPKQQVTCMWCIDRHSTRLLNLPMWPVITVPLTIYDHNGNILPYITHDPNMVELMRIPQLGMPITLIYEGGHDTVPEDVVNATLAVMQAIKCSNYNIGTVLKAGSVETMIDMPPKVLAFATRQILTPYMRIAI